MQVHLVALIFKPCLAMRILKHAESFFERTHPTHGMEVSGALLEL